MLHCLCSLIGTERRGGGLRNKVLEVSGRKREGRKVDTEVIITCKPAVEVIFFLENTVELNREKNLTYCEH